MSSMIGLLELLGQDETLRYADRDALALAAQGAGIEGMLLDALLQRDRARLQSLMQCQATICCGLVRPEPGEPDKEPGKDDDDEIRSVRAA